MRAGWISLLVVVSTAHADDLPPVQPVEAGRQFVFDLALSFEIGLSKDNAGNPVSIAPDVSIQTGRAPKIAVIHSAEAFTGFHGIPLGSSLCVSGELCDAFEPHTYHSAGIQLSKVLRSHVGADGEMSDSAFAIEGGLLAYNLDPLALALKLGMRAGYLSSDLVALEIHPNVHIALTERSTLEDRVFVPVTMATLASRKFSFQLESGVAAPFDELVDYLVVPLGLNIDVLTTSDIDLFASFTFPALYGGDAIAVTGFDARVLTVGVRVTTLLGGEK